MAQVSELQPQASALLVVDPQVDFCEGGALAVEGGAKVCRNIAALLEQFDGLWDYIVFSRDWHLPDSSNGGHFAAEPDYIDTWPAHCVEGTMGAQFSPYLANAHPDVVISKGQDAPAYSAFEGTTPEGGTLDAWLKQRGVEEIAVCGLALDYCVKASALDASRLGYATVLLPTMTAAVHSKFSEILAVHNELRAHDVSISE